MSSSFLSTENVIPGSRRDGNVGTGVAEGIQQNSTHDNRSATSPKAHTESVEQQPTKVRRIEDTATVQDEHFVVSNQGMNDEEIPHSTDSETATALTKDIVQGKQRASYKNLSLQEKLHVIESVQSKDKTQSQLAKELGVSRQCIHKIVKTSKLYVGAQADGRNPELTKVKNVSFPQLETRVLEWLKEHRENATGSTPLNVGMAREFAQKEAVRLGVPSQMFTASNGWWWRFRRRNKEATRFIRRNRRNGSRLDLPDKVTKKTISKLSESSASNKDSSTTTDTTAKTYVAGVPTTADVPNTAAGSSNNNSTTGQSVPAALNVESTTSLPNVQRKTQDANAEESVASRVVSTLADLAAGSAPKSSTQSAANAKSTVTGPRKQTAAVQLPVGIAPTSPKQPVAANK